ncbi:excreted virulence factor EspC (type VII ESX diderm) [Nocardia mexicana]|uniref:Excreted virulence factor EspC (Type VII ESX diderm) n=2 Tax=Nocardia mexicana TaxID=279262 RepID=A0A370GM94_9NOCA|nr:excreted virulence factor EspC (type VII ESX diderm) [Nocardia mexicana]
MYERLEVDPQALREAAEQHREVARDIRAWSEPPTEWLASFEDQFGKVADSIRQALEVYYEARHRAGTALANDHDDTADRLMDSADSYEQVDDDGASSIRRASHGAEQPGPMLDAKLSESGVVAAAPAGSGDAVGAGTPPTAEGALLPSTASSAGAPAGRSAERRYASKQFTVVEEPDSSVGPLMPVAVVYTPFASAVSGATDKAAGLPHVVGDPGCEDLIVARTLLRSVLAAVDPAVVGLSWAVSVMRGDVGARVFITSSEARGWVPAGLFLPREVSTPWVWDDFLGTETSGGPGSAWEGIDDPARVLVEFGLRWGSKVGARLSALASSRSVDPTMRSHFADAAMEGPVPPAPDIDLRVPGPGTVDRLGLAGSEQVLERLVMPSDTQIQSRCLELAIDAHTRVGRTWPNPAEAYALPARRERILGRVRADRPVPPHWWEELRDSDDLLVAWMTSMRIDPSRIDLGELRADDDSLLRAAAFERRCNELVLLLGEEPTRQCLRDSVYAYGQIVNHPLLAAASSAVPSGTAARHTVQNAADEPPTVAAVTSHRQSAASPSDHPLPYRD